MTNRPSERVTCTKCHHPAIISQRYSGLHLCREHFIRDLEGKAKRDIRKNRWLRPNDRIGVAISGGAASAAALTLLLKLTGERRDLSITARHIDEGDADATERVQRLAGGLEISIGRRDPSRHLREDIRSLAEGCTAVVTGETLDEEAARVMKAFVSGEIAPLTHSDEFGLIRWISPFLLIREEEVRLYASLHHDEIFPDEPDIEDLAGSIRSILRDYTDRHPSTLYAVTNLGGQIRGAARDPKE